jgi:cell division protein FtsQ
MQINWNYIKMIALLLVVFGLYSFSNYRSESKKVNDINIEFVGDQGLYINESMVNKLLIQNYGSLKNVPKEKLVLNKIEKVIESSKMIKKAKVFLTINGELEARVEQRKPIGRIEGSSKFYLDDDGERMPLSMSHSARVPIITGDITGESLEDVYEILKYINEDQFLRKNVIGIHIKELNDYQLRFRMEQFVVNLGGIDSLEEKFSNFKAFYTKADKDKILGNYNVVSLEFDNQVVCTKI